MRLYALTYVDESGKRRYWRYRSGHVDADFTAYSLMDLDIAQTTLNIWRTPGSTEYYRKWELQAFDIVPGEICYTAPVD